jgi:hypothetical protein
VDVEKRIVPFERSQALCTRTLYRKNALRASQELTRLHLSQALRYKIVTHLKLSLEKRATRREPSLPRAA